MLIPYHCSELAATLFSRTSNWTWWQYTKLFLVLVLVAHAFMQVTNAGDFKVFLDAADVLKQGQSPYHIWFVHHNCIYLYSPFFATLLIPFSSLPQVLVNLLWILANLFFTYRCFQLIRKYLPPVFSKPWQNELLLLIPIVCVLRFWLYNIELLQMTLFMLWCMLESLDQFEKRNYWLGGFLLALGINIKLLPLVLLPYLLIRRHEKAFVPIFLFSLVFLFFPALFFGIDFNNQLLHNWWVEINPSMGKQYSMETDLGPHSLNALVPSLLMKTNGDYPLTRNVMDLSPPTVMLILNTIRASLILLTLYFTGTRPHKAASNLQTARELSYIILIIPLIFPHQQKYAFFLALPALTYLMWYLIEVHKRKFATVSKTRWRMIIVLLVAAFVLMTLTTDGLIGLQLNQISQHFKLVTYGALVLGVALVMAPVKHIEREKLLSN